jgi:hypothetical protein
MAISLVSASTPFWDQVLEYNKVAVCLLQQHICVVAKQSALLYAGGMQQGIPRHKLPLLGCGV